MKRVSTSSMEETLAQYQANNEELEKELSDLRAFMRSKGITQGDSEAEEIDEDEPRELSGIFFF